MGHTIPAKRHILYTKMEQLKKFARTLRKPQREKLESLIESSYHHVSGLVYTNGLNDEEAIIYAMLANLAQIPGFQHAERVRKCLAILLAEE